MEFVRQEENILDAANNQELVQLTDLQLLAVGGGVADITFS